MSAGAELTLVMLEMLTPFAIMLFAALTMLIPIAFCSAAPERLTLDEAEELIDEPSTATFPAVADPMSVAPATVSTT